MIDFQSPAIVLCQNHLAAIPPLPAGEGEPNCSSRREPALVEIPPSGFQIPDSIVHLCVLGSSREKSVFISVHPWLKKAFLPNEPIFNLPLGLSKPFKGIQSASKLFKGFGGKILSQCPGLLGCMAVHGFGSHVCRRMHFRSNLPLLPPFPSVQKFVSIRSNPHPHSRTLRPPANLTGQMQTTWTGKLNKKFMQPSLTLDLATASALERMGHSCLTKFRMILGKFNQF
ncbi:MAG TPA: hypothetical protein VNU95_08165 [Candidatus Acidoferrales bacterium]|jgi:hypothetical protein|nr:hypothetical protein [Candidatus Acidoferrales bacterium]